MHEGEIVGLYGLIGAGRSEFAMGVFGRQPTTRARCCGRAARSTIRSERDAIDLGIALAPESRRDQGLCLNLGVGLNLNLPIFERLTQRRHDQTARASAMAADKQIADLRIKTASRNALALSLSGGNQQKIVIGKWLNHGAKLFIFDEPTVGVDVGTKAEIYRLFGALLSQGRGHPADLVLPAGSLRAGRPLHVLRGGRQVASHGFKAADHEQILTEAIGV